MEELLAAQDCGETYSPGDAAALEASLLELYENRNRLKQMARNAERVFKKRFTAESVYGEMVDYLAEVVRWYRNRPNPIPSGNGSTLEST